MAVLQTAKITQLGDDSWRWAKSSYTSYTVKAAYWELTRAMTKWDFEDLRTVWTHSLPLTVSVFLWRASLGRLPSRLNLLRRGIRAFGDVASCPVCGQGQEDEQHILAGCNRAVEVWNLFFCWWQVLTVMPGNWLLVIQQGRGSFGRRKARIWALSGAAVCWALWRARNDLVFNQVDKDPEVILYRAKVWAYEWMHANSNTADFSLDLWLGNPHTAVHSMAKQHRRRRSQPRR
ncbi:hypothetical protein Ancab_040030 [Ancistrocladus abbreviatus]